MTFWSHKILVSNLLLLPTSRKGGGEVKHITHKQGKHITRAHFDLCIKSTATRSLPETLHWKTCRPDHHFSHFLLAAQVPAYISTNIFLQNFHNAYNEVTYKLQPQEDILLKTTNAGILVTRYKSNQPFSPDWRVYSFRLRSDQTITSIYCPYRAQ